MVDYKMGVAPVLAVMAVTQVAKGIKESKELAAMAQATKRETDANIFNQQQKFNIDKDRLTRQQEQFAGKQTVTAAGSGATLGSFDSLFADTSQQSVMDQALLEYDKNLNIANTAYEGQMKKKQLYGKSRSALLSGFQNGAMTMFGGAAGGAASGASGFAANAGSNSMGQIAGAQMSSSSYGPYLNYGSRSMSGY